jgi:hypothetical protein
VVAGGVDSSFLINLVEEKGLVEKEGKKRERKWK